MEGTEKHKSVLETSQTSTSSSRLTLTTPKKSCKNLEYIENGLIIHYTSHYWIKQPELRQKYALGYMQTSDLQKNFKAEQEVKAKPTLLMKSWQVNVITIRDPNRSCWLVDSTANVHVHKDKSLMSAFTENPIRVGGLTLDSISPGGEKIKIRLTLKDG